MPLLERLEAQSSGTLGMSVISYAELSVGARSAKPEDERQLAALAQIVRIIVFDNRAAESYGRLIRQIGVQRRSFDRLIAAHALALGITLITNNEADFADIPGLKVENWTL